jgi:uncharacterized membrane protein YphA (DoxX/SURF4 family)
MNAVVVVARLVLAAVFAVAGWTKARDVVGTRAAVHDFGIPAPFIAPVAFLLPVAELTVAVLLLFEDTAAIGAIGAIVLLALFIVAIAVSLARGRRPDCHCFGQVRSEPVSATTLVRNWVLIALAIFVATQ